MERKLATGDGQMLEQRFLTNFTDLYDAVKDTGGDIQLARVRNLVGYNKHADEAKQINFHQGSDLREYWESHSEVDWPKICPVQNTYFKTDTPGVFHVMPCDEDELLGVPALLLDINNKPIDRDVRIVPLCKWHSSEDRNGSVFKIDEKLVVLAPAKG